jgi:protein subunit release factor B
MEIPQGFHTMSQEELDEYNNIRHQRILLLAKRAENAERKRDLEAYLARKRREKLAWQHEARNLEFSIKCINKRRAFGLEQKNPVPIHGSLCSL